MRKSNFPSRALLISIFDSTNEKHSYNPNIEHFFVLDVFSVMEKPA